MAICWKLDGHLAVAKTATEHGLSRDSASDVGLIFDVFKVICEQEVNLDTLHGSDNWAPFSMYERVNGDHVINVTLSLLKDNLRSYLLISECMACCVDYDDDNKANYSGIIEQVYLEERNPQMFFAEYPQVQVEREANLGALEVLFPTRERLAYVDDFTAGSLDTVQLAGQLGVPPAVLERSLAPAYMQYCVKQLGIC